MPFLVRWPTKIEAGVQCKKIVWQTDLLATFAELFNVLLADNEGEDSYSMLPYWKGKSKSKTQ